MFKFLNFLQKRDTKIRTQLHVFLKWRRKKGMSLADYTDWLELFIEHSTKDDILDITAVDVLEFVERVRDLHHNSQYSVRRAEIAVRQFKRFYSARNHIMKDIKDYTKLLANEGVNFVADIKRNRDICRKWFEDQKNPLDKRRYSTRRLAEIYGISHVRVYQIIKRDLPKYAPRGTFDTQN